MAHKKKPHMHKKEHKHEEHHEHKKDDHKHGAKAVKEKEAHMMKKGAK